MEAPLGVGFIGPVGVMSILTSSIGESNKRYIFIVKTYYLDKLAKFIKHRC